MPQRDRIFSFISRFVDKADNFTRNLFLRLRASLGRGQTPGQPGQQGLTQPHAEHPEFGQEPLTARGGESTNQVRRSVTEAPSSSEGLLRGSRYQLVSNDPNFKATISNFNAWMTELERVLTIHLFHSAAAKPSIPFIRIETKPFNGVAYTHDFNGGKRIVVSSTYLAKLSSSRRWAELSGLTIHELTHALQNNGRGRMPGYLVEAIADYIRMRSGLSSPSWRKQFTDPNAAYAGGAFFLDYIDKQYPGFVKSLNERSRTGYSDALYSQITGKSKSQLWSDYKRANGY